jgi:NTE family protein
VAVLATAAIEEPVEDDGRYDCEPPDFGDGALHLLNGALVDPMIEDLRMLGNVNAFFTGSAPGARRYREARGKRPYRPVPYLFVGPVRRGVIGELAMEVFRSRYGGLRGLLSPDFPVLSRLLGGDSPAQGDLLSYLFFDPEFVTELIAKGADDARRCLAPGDEADGPWRTGPLETFVAS